MKLIKKIFTALFLKLLQKKHGVLIFFSHKSKKEAVDFFKKIREETFMAYSDLEAYRIYRISKNIKSEGDFAEVGVYRGGSARILIETKGNRELHLFDTFEGIPYVGRHDSKGFYVGQFKTNFDIVKNYLKFPGVYLHKGLFPDTAHPVTNKKFAFVHLDVDVYQSTFDSLEFFYPRLSKGGCIVSHDYYDEDEGVRKAFQDFFKDKIEPIIELHPSQVLIVKV